MESSKHQRTSTNLLGHVGYGAAAIAIAAMGWGLIVVVNKLEESARSVTHTLEILQVISDIDESASRAEAAQRGYLLSGAESFLAERDEAVGKTRSSIASVRRLTADSPAQQARVGQLDSFFGQRVAIMEENARRRREVGLAAAASFAAGGAGQRASARIYSQTAELEAEELRQLAARRLDEERARRGAIGILVAVVALVLLVMIPSYLGFLRQARLRHRAERRLLDLAETLPGAVVQYRTWPDGRSKYEFLSPAVERMRGVDRAAALADPQVILRTILDSDRQGLIDALAEGAKTLSPVEHDYRIRAPDGSIRWLRTTAAPRKGSEGSVVWSAFWSDVTERRALLAQLYEAKDQAEAASRAKGIFLATMSHEIRTPMNGVLGMLELLALTKLDIDQRKTLGVIRESGRSLLRIIDDILDFSKVEAGKLELRPEPTSIADLIARSCDVYRGSASSKGLAIHCVVDPRIGPALLVDPVRLQQILNNFMSNAIKFTQKGTVEVRVVQEARGAGTERIRFTVEDSGIGISAEDREKLFAPFSQVAGGAHGGTGLGLAICGRLAEMMGGSIEMHSEVGVGTRLALVLTLPIADPRELPSASVPASLPERAGSPRSLPSPDRAAEEGTLILVVDDHPINRMVLLRQVNALGYAAEAAVDGVEALDRWESGRFALVLTDCNMPRMNGYDLARNIREREAQRGRRRTTVIACTANALGGEAEKCLAAGMDDYLAKPAHLAQLESKLSRWLPLPEEESVLDANVIAEISGGVPEVEREIILHFHRENAKDVRSLAQALDAKAIEDATLFAHRIKGSARTVGAKPLAEVCERLEDAGRRNDWAVLLAEMEAFDRELARLDARVGSLRQDGENRA